MRLLVWDASGDPKQRARDNPGGKEKKAMVTTDNGQPQIPDPAALDGVVQQAVAQLRGVYQLLPDFVPAPVEGVKAMRAARSVSDDFLEASAVAAENDATMQATTGT